METVQKEVARMMMKEYLMDDKEFYGFWREFVKFVMVGVTCERRWRRSPLVILICFG